MVSDKMASISNVGRITDEGEIVQCSECGRILPIVTINRNMVYVYGYSDYLGKVHCMVCLFHNILRNLPSFLMCYIRQLLIRKQEIVENYTKVYK